MKHQCGETLGDLEPVYDLLTIMGEITPSESLSRFTYTGINSIHPEKTKQPYIRSTRNNRTRKKKSEVEDLQKSPKKIKKNQSLEQLEQLKSTESLKIERPQNNPPKRTKYIKTSLQITKKGTPKDTKAKEQDRAEKANK